MTGSEKDDGHMRWKSLLHAVRRLTTPMRHMQRILLDKPSIIFSLESINHVPIFLDEILRIQEYAM